MNQIKRQLDENFLSHTEIIKKSRKSTFEENEIITCIEDLSNEIFYEIFDYLNSYDIFKIFFKLNRRFYHLINHSFLPIKIDRSNSISYLLHTDYTAFLMVNRCRIISIYIHNEFDMSCFNLLLTDYTLFNRLESLSLEKIQYTTLISLLLNLSMLPRLFSLKINLNGKIINFAEVYSLIFTLPVLKYSKLSAIGKFSNLPLLSNTNQFSSIQYLINDYGNDINDIFSILSYTPCLRYLICSYVRSNVFIPLELPLNNIHLKHVFFKNCHLKFDHFEILIKTCFFSIEILRFGITMDNTYFDAIRWEELILKYMPYLRILNFDCWEYYVHQSIPKLYHSNLSQFISSFWIQRKWFLQLKIRTESYSSMNITYSIRPIKKQWYELQNNMNTDQITLIEQKCMNSPFAHIHLSFVGLHHFEYYRLFQEYAHNIPGLVKCISLQLDLHKFSIDMLIQILHLLPDLDSLTITSNISEETKILSPNQTKMLCFTSNYNKITKVNLEQMTELDQVHILLDLCPHMRYFQVKCRNITDAEWLIRYVLTKRNRNFIPHLYLLCIWISNADNKIMNYLQKIIDNEKLIENYLIKRICDRIYFQLN